jgi:hypothetical protein
MQSLPQRNRNRKRLSQVVDQKIKSEAIQSKTDKALAKVEAKLPPQPKRRRRRNVQAQSKADKEFARSLGRLSIVPRMLPAAASYAGRNAPVKVAGGSRNLLSNPINRQNSRGASAYLKAVVAPQLFSARIPDFHAFQTALYPSIQEYDVHADFSTDEGRFSLCVQPKVGTGSQLDPKKFKMALVNSPLMKPWDTYTDWADETGATYAPTSGGKNVTLDQFANVMCQSEITTQIFESGGTTGDHNPFGDAPVYKVNEASLPQVASVSQISGDSVFSVPAGNWLIVVVSQTSTGVIGNISVNPFPTSTPSCQYVDFGSQTFGTGPSGAVRLGWVSSLPGFSTPLQFTIDTDGGSVGAFTSSMILSPSNAQGVINDAGTAGQEFLNGGSAQKMRPVGMSVLYSSLLTPLQDGGDVSIGCVNGNSVAQNYFTQSNQNVGNLQLWENLAGVKGCKSFKHDVGGYCFWKPEDVQCFAMRTPNDMNSHMFPGIIVSGQCTNTTLTGLVRVGRVRVAVLWEFETSVSLYNVGFSDQTAGVWDETLQALMRMDNVCENPNHRVFIQKLLGIGDWILNKGIPFAQAAIPLVAGLLA